MDKNCSNCEFNFGGNCAGYSTVYKYGEPITDDTLYCDRWSAGLEYFEYETQRAPRFLRDAFNDCRITYSTFSNQFHDFLNGNPIPIDFFEAIKYIYKISMVDIAVIANVSFGVVYRAKTKGFTKKRAEQISRVLCVPEKLLYNTSTSDFECLERCKQEFFAKPGIEKLLESMPDWKMELARDISANYFRCPIHVAKIIARVDKLYWDIAFDREDFTESELFLIDYVTRKATKHNSLHKLEYFIDIASNPHLRKIVEEA